jgi:Protein of unknown function (DUF2860)
MKLKGCLVWVVVALSVALAGSPALALDPIQSKSGFSGFVQPGLGFLSIKSNTVAKVLSFDLSEKRTSALDNNPDAENTVLVTVPFKLAYTFAGTGTELFFGTDIGDMLAFDTAQQLGIKQSIGSLGVLQAGVLFSGNVRVWKDPYVTGQSRDDTDRKNVGAQLVWDKVFGSNLELEYSLRKVDIGDEQSGQFLGLTPSQQDRLDRNGTIHRFEAAYGFKLGANHTLKPSVAVFYEDLDGEAMANGGVDFRMTYIWNSEPFTLVANAYVGYAEYDKSNPVFDETRTDDRFGVSGTIYYTNPWGYSFLGSEPWRFFATGAYFAVDSNTNFYNQEAGLVMGGIAFRWK